MRNFVEGWGCGGGIRREEERLMGLSGETVIVCDYGLTRAARLTDVRVFQLSMSMDRQRGTSERARERERETAPPALRLTSAPVIWYTTDSPSEYDCTVSRQTAGPLSLPARPPACLPRSSFLRLGCLNLPGSSDSRRKSDKVCSTLQTPFPNTIKLLTHPAWLALFILVICWWCEAISLERIRDLQRVSNLICLFNECFDLLMQWAGLEMLELRACGCERVGCQE